MKLKLEDDRQGGLRLLADGKPVCQYNYGAVSRPEFGNDNYTRNAYLHPVWTPSGKVITDDWAEKDNHLHHRGVWFAWTKTEIHGRPHDFWNLGEGTGKIFFAKFLEKFPDGSGFVSEHEWKTGAGGVNTRYDEVVLRERWTVRCAGGLAAPNGGPAAPPQGFWLDLTTQQEALVPVRLPAYRYGGMAFRGAPEWQPKTFPLTVITSEGDDRRRGDENRARWWHVQGNVGTDASGQGGEPVGFAMFDAPSNKNHPSPMRLNPDIPYFGFFPFQKEEFTIQPGQPISFSYRLLIHDGQLSPQAIEALWQAWAKESR